MILAALLLASVPTVPATPTSMVDFTWTFLKMFAALGAVSVLAILVLKCFVPKLGLTKRFQRSKYFHILGRAPLEPKKSLYLVQCGERYFILGVADAGINVISEISRDEAVAEKT